MSCGTLVVGWLTIFVPPGHAFAPIETDQYHNVFGIPGNTTDEWSTRITGRTEALVEVWSGQPPYPGQPAVTLSSKTVQLRSGAVDIQRRKIAPVGETFSVAYPTEPGGKGQALVRVDKSSDDAGRELIAAILGGGVCRSVE